MKYKHATVGGTFDHFHKGHKILLERAFAASDTVWIGLTTPSYLSTLNQTSAKKFPPVEEFSIRKKYLEEWLNKRELSSRADIIPIDDKFGTTLKNEQIEAIVVSSETELTATEINLLRAQKGWSALEVIVVPWVLAQDGKPINSDRIRSGKIDRKGRLYRLEKDWGVRKLPDNLRQKLKQPLGKLAGDLSYLGHQSHLKPKIIITVGDVVTANFLKRGVIPSISIVDLKVARKPVYKNVAEIGFREIKLLKNAKNEAGTISKEAEKALFSLIQSEAKPCVLQINGEEDLLTLLAIFVAPLNSLIVYGQPLFAKVSGDNALKNSGDGVGSGIVVVEVTEEKKQAARRHLAQFQD